ncbi:GntR family transcriptional regulator [Mycobacterium camsae]|uniref:GntR family transcriptional regulator n=1 Tax=Mycobacterium gordonae TaxID=1778 RepID=UPI00197E3B41|nr:GntR family transcriptional regulator [Mycobacterium gordonae]
MGETTGATSRLAEALRAQIVAGELAPGSRLSEEHVREAYGVSRSTLREAFQWLIRERLLVHELSRGVFVRQLSRDDIADLYEVRRVVECAALRHSKTLTPNGLRKLSAAIEEGQAAADECHWDAVAAASIKFHESLIDLVESDRLSSIMSGVLAEFRLAYAHMRDTQLFHAAFLKRHEEIAGALRAGATELAADLLEKYLNDAEDALLRSFGV